MPDQTVTVRYGGPVPVTLPSLGLDLVPGQVFTVTLDAEQADLLLHDPSGQWEAVQLDVEGASDATPPSSDEAEKE